MGAAPARKSKSPARTRPADPPPQAESLSMFAAPERQAAAAVIVIVAAVVAAYVPTLAAADFVDIDDGQYVLQNERVLNPTLHNAWLFLREVERPRTVAGYYQPLSMISLMVDGWLSRGQADPMIFHLTNVLLHALNSVLVFLIARAACGGIVAPVMAALLFALHPIQVESVTWISQRKTVLATALALGAILCHISAARTGRARSRWGGVGLFVLAMAAKPTVMFLPLVLLLLDVWPLRRMGRRAWLEKWPYLPLMLGGMWIAYVSQQATADIGVPNVERAYELGKLCLYNLTMYARNLAWPMNLAFIYPIPEDFGWGNVAMTASVLAALAGLGLWLGTWHWSRPLFVGCGGALLFLGVAIGPVRFMQSCVGDRFMYLPLAMLALPVAAGLARVFRRSPSGAAITPRGGLAGLAAVIVLGGLASRTSAYQMAWGSSEGLWANVLARIPDSTLANAGLARARLQAWERQQSIDEMFNGRPMLEEALAYVDRAIASDPHSGAYRADRAAILIALQRGPEAVQAADTALSLGLGPLTLQGKVTLGRALALAKRPDEALRVFNELLAGDEYVNAAFRMQMGHALAKAGRNELAVPFFESAAALTPRDDKPLVMLGAAAAGAGDWPRAARAYQQAADILASRGEQSVGLDLGLAKVWLELGQPEAALPLLANPELQENEPAQRLFVLAGAAALRGDRDTALSSLADAVRLDPTLAALAAKKRYFDALHDDPRWRGVVVGAQTSPRGDQ